MQKLKGLISFIVLLLAFSLLATNSVLGASPWDQNDVPVNKVWTVTFNNEIDESTISNENIYVENSKNEKLENVKVELNKENLKKVTISNLDKYNYGEQYWLIVTGSVKSTDGKPLKAQIKMSFNTMKNEAVDIERPPSKVNGLEGQVVRNTTIFLNWGLVDDINYYNIYRSTGDSKKYELIDKSVDNSFIDINLSELMSYSYKISAVNQYGEGFYSDELSLTTSVVPGGSNITGNTLGNIVNGGIVAGQDDWIYLNGINKKTNGLLEFRIEKVKKDLSSKRKLDIESENQLHVIGDYIYYLEKDSYSFNRLNLITNKKTTLFKSDVANPYVNIIGNTVYYTALDGIYSVKTDSSNKQKIHNGKVTNLNVDSNWIYFKNLDDKGTIYKISTAGQNLQKINDDRVKLFQVNEEWIYYIDSDSSDLYKINTNGAYKTKLDSSKKGSINSINVDKGIIYYLEETYESTVGHSDFPSYDSIIYSMDKNGENKKVVYELRGTRDRISKDQISILDDWIYISTTSMSYGDDTRRRISKDGKETKYLRWIIENK